MPQPRHTLAFLLFGISHSGLLHIVEIALKYTKADVPTFNSVHAQIIASKLSGDSFVSGVKEHI